MGQAAGGVLGGPQALIDVVFFDIDDTLYDQAGPFAYAVRRVCGDIPDATDAELYDASRRHSGPIFAAFSARRAPTTDEYALRMQQTLADFGVAIDHATAVEAQRVYAVESGVAMSLSFAMASCLDVCRARARLGVGVISNGRSAAQGEKLDILGVSRWVGPGGVFVSQAVGAAKPDPSLFRHACERMGTRPGRCVYVGDAWDTDVVGAWAAGMPCIWLNRRGRRRPQAPRGVAGVAPTWEVRSEEDLLALLGSACFWRTGRARRAL
ncbi:MAG: HAD family hydrolase [Coriobacteriaceae bacterium]|uniref:HAD family hydrolase n=1 Tax=Tractidigestivibacter sp. TaxID=2847320 RepID=UPI002A82812E|nr:HAD family hydrolase [Tractidigestivibacter sp.]MCI6844033.1 HAD family hydrolase [Coriobacteriaceae bacterium]MDD7583389.1 HAD family hydrolase [Coriobacteriaceae bacterium]MDY4535333.1 HAD family hydrolase [Tractidigestivibacter sp.]